MSGSDRGGGDKSLTAKQRRFVEEYLIDTNATQAAIRAGYSTKTACEQGSRLLANVKVSAVVDEGLAKLLKKTEVTAERIAEELALLGFSNIQDCFDEKDNLIPIAKLPRAKAAALSSVEVVRRVVPGTGGDGEEPEVEYVHKIKLWDKRAALVDLGKHYGMFKERIEHTGPNGGPILTKELSDLETIDRLLGMVAAASGVNGQSA